MTLLNTTNRYGTVSIALHWLMLLLLAAVYACIELRVLFPKGSDPREAIKALHFMLGLSVLGLVAVRLLFRWCAPTPRIQPEPPRWRRVSAGTMHAALYVLMIGMPLLGWLTLSAEGKVIPFFGFELPALVGKDKAQADLFEEIHETAGLVGYYLIGLHAAAALFGHYFMRDNTLIRMLPSRR